MNQQRSHSSLLAVVQSVASAVRCEGKLGRRLLQPSIAAALKAASFEVDQEDQRGFLASGMSPWRSKDTGLPEITTSRRRLDLVVYIQDRPIALIETESDLDDLRPPGVVNRRSGHYDVHSISSDAQGRPFESYKSLERMAAAAFYAAVAQSSGSYPSPAEGCRLLEGIRSDAPDEHNPHALLLVLVSGRVRANDPSLLEPRLKALGAYLVAANAA